MPLLRERRSVLRVERLSGRFFQERRQEARGVSARIFSMLSALVLLAVMITGCGSKGTGAPQESPPATRSQARSADLPIPLGDFYRRAGNPLNSTEPAWVLLDIRRTDTGVVLSEWVLDLSYGTIDNVNRTPGLCWHIDFVEIDDPVNTPPYGLEGADRISGQFIQPEVRLSATSSTGLEDIWHRWTEDVPIGEDLRMQEIGGSITPTLSRILGAHFLCSD
jgi:predicted small lipoprotein YifL